MYSNVNFPNVSIPQGISYNRSSVNPTVYPASKQGDDRFIAGGFLGPFILGGITGGLLAPAFYNPGYGYGRPVYNNYYYPPYYYGPYYR